MVVCTPIGEGRYRIVIHDKSLPARPDPGSLTFTQVADAWQRLTGEHIGDAQPLWLWACGNAAELACQYRQGRVLLAGDAAHAIPPLAAWGLSAGLQDAANLGWKLAATISGWAPDDLLDTYHAERQPIGAQLARNASAAIELRLTGEEMDSIRSVVTDLVACTDAAELLAGMLSGLGIRYDLGAGSSPLLGRRMPPDRELLRPDGTSVRIADLLHDATGLLIVTAGCQAELAAGGWADRVNIVTGGWAPDPAGPAPDAVLIRPDGYIAWTEPGTDDSLTDALTRWFGTAREFVKRTPVRVPARRQVSATHPGSGEFAQETCMQTRANLSPY